MIHSRTSEKSQFISLSGRMPCIVIIKTDFKAGTELPAPDRSHMNLQPPGPFESCLEQAYGNGPGAPVTVDTKVPIPTGL